MTPEAAMRLALAEARRASGRAFPNPPVGAVVFRGERVLGRGHTQPVGGPHAEITAVDAALQRHGTRALRGAAIAVTLEPCSHVGRTPPCADRLIEVGLRRVLVGHRDPHPAVAGRGLARLRRAGLRVEVGVLERACREQHRGFLCVIASGRPFGCQLAATLPPYSTPGDSRWISCPAARSLHIALTSPLLSVGSDTASPTTRHDAPSGGRVVHRPLRLVAAPTAPAPSARSCARAGLACLCVPAAAARAASGSRSRRGCSKLPREGNI